MDCTKMPYDNEFECAIDKGTADQPFLLDLLGSNYRLGTLDALLVRCSLAAFALIG